MADTLQELWISYNNIEKLKGITALVNLQVYRFSLLDPYIELTHLCNLLSQGAVHVQQQCQGLGGVSEDSRATEATGPAICGYVHNVISE